MSAIVTFEHERVYIQGDPEPLLGYREDGTVRGAILYRSVLEDAVEKIDMGIGMATDPTGMKVEADPGAYADGQGIAVTPANANNGGVLWFNQPQARGLVYAWQQFVKENPSCYCPGG